MTECFLFFAEKIKKLIVMPLKCFFLCNIDFIQYWIRYDATRLLGLYLQYLNHVENTKRLFSQNGRVTNTNQISGIM